MEPGSKLSFGSESFARTLITLLSPPGTVAVSLITFGGQSTQLTTLAAMVEVTVFSYPSFAVAETVMGIGLYGTVHGVSKIFVQPDP